MGVSVVLTDGFDDDEVVVSAGGRSSRLAGTTTKMLTGLAGEVQVASDPGTVVQVELLNRAVAPLQHTMADGKALVVSVVDGALVADEFDETPGFM